MLLIALTFFEPAAGVSTARAGLADLDDFTEALAFAFTADFDGEVTGFLAAVFRVPFDFVLLCLMPIELAAILPRLATRNS